MVLKEKKKILSFYLGFDCFGWVFIMGDFSWVLVFVVALVVECFGWERASEVVVFYFYFFMEFAIGLGGFLSVFCGFNSS